MSATTTTERNVRSIEEFLAQTAPLDNTAIFETLSGIMGELRAKMMANFELHASPMNAKYGSYSAPTGLCRGSLRTYSGPEITYLVDSWMGSPETGFTNLHFNTWLGPQSKVPHLAIVFGTIPDLFFYFDFVPRSDLTTDLEYLDRYYQAEANDRFVAFNDDSRLRPFVSRDVYMRQAISPVGLCFTGPRDPALIQHLRTTAHDMMDQWLGWVKKGHPVPAAEQKALGQRDMTIRRAVAERDPANSLAEQLLGKEQMNTLVNLLWGTESSAT